MTAEEVTNNPPFSPAKKMYYKEAPIEVIIEDNDVESRFLEYSLINISQSI